jgi:hypothetical protein
MGFIKQTFTGIICDNCKAQFRETEDHAFFFDEDNANEEVTSEEWIVEKQKHYCEKCHSRDENDNIIINQERFKTE